MPFALTNRLPRQVFTAEPEIGRVRFGVVGKDAHARVIHILHPDSAMRAQLFAIASQVPGRLIFSYPSAHDFLENWRERGAGIVLTAELLADASGLDILAAVSDDRRMRGILLLAEPKFGIAMAAHRLGVFDVVIEPIQPEATADLITRALDVVSQDARLIDIQQFAQGRLTRLTARERVVAQMLAFGSSNKAIARDLDISVRTVEIHRSNVMRRLQIDSLAALVQIMLVANLADLGVQTEVAEN